MRKYLYSIILSLTLFQSCTPPPKIWYHNFSYEEENQIQEAMRQWNTILKQPMSFDENARWTVVKEYPPNPAYTGETLHTANRVYISPETHPDMFYSLVLHELGHVNGLRHTQAGVMAPNITGLRKFTNEDIEECIRVGACDPQGYALSVCRFQGVCP